MALLNCKHIVASSLRSRNVLITASQGRWSKVNAVHFSTAQVVVALEETASPQGNNFIE